jgi:hypothetical protein
VTAPSRSQRLVRARKTRLPGPAVVRTAGQVRVDHSRRPATRGSSICEFGYELGHYRFGGVGFLRAGLQRQITGRTRSRRPPVGRGRTSNRTPSPRLWRRICSWVAEAIAALPRVAPEPRPWLWQRVVDRICTPFGGDRNRSITHRAGQWASRQRFRQAMMRSSDSCQQGGR